jgi:hypothetical protein
MGKEDILGHLAAEFENDIVSHEEVYKEPGLLIDFETAKQICWVLDQAEKALGYGLPLPQDVENPLNWMRLP